MTRGHTEKAMSTLQRIASENGKPLPPGRLVEPSNKVSSEDYMPTHVIGGLLNFILKNELKMSLLIIE